MRREPLSITAVLNEAGDLVTQTAAPWVGVLVLAVLPFRFAQAKLIVTLQRTGAQARYYGDILSEIGLMVAATLVLATIGRAIFVHACSLAASAHATPGREAWRVSPAAVACYLYTTFLFHLLLIALSFTIIAIPMVLVLSGLAAATCLMNERPSVVEPLRLIGRQLTHVRTLIGISLVLFAGILAAQINLFFAFQLGLWVAGGVIGLDVQGWKLLMSEKNSLFDVLLIGGALMAVEPFWLAANIVYVQKVQARRTGEDLLVWLRRLGREAMAEP